MSRLRCYRPFQTYITTRNGHYLFLVTTPPTAVDRLDALFEMSHERSHGRPLETAFAAPPWLLTRFLAPLTPRARPLITAEEARRSRPFGRTRFLLFIAPILWDGLVRRHSIYYGRPSTGRAAGNALVKRLTQPE